MIRKVGFLFLLVAYTTTITAQCSAKATKLYEKAKKLQYMEAEASLELLQKAYKICPTSEQIIFLLADIQNTEKNYTEVVSVLSSYVNSNGIKNPKANYFLADAQMQIFDFEAAIKNYKIYLDSEATNRTLRLRAARKIKDAQFSKYSYANPKEATFISFSPSVNSKASEYLPIMTADESIMVFTRRETVTEEAYFIERKPDNTWTSPRTLVGLPPQFRKAAVSMSIDGQMLVFAMADHPRGIGNFDLYYMEIKNGEWTQPSNFGPEVNTPGWESQPCISADGRTVFFSTDRKGGEGGYDLWKTKRQLDGSWSAPTNLGLDINGPENEESPFIHRDQRTLYFRSESHPGLGSFDIFMSRMIRFKKWTEPVNLGYPINTRGNDGSLFVSLDGKDAYISSNVDHLNLSDYKKQEIKKDLDIYSFNLAEEFRPIPTTYIKLKFVDVNQEPQSPYIELLDYRNGDTLFIGTPDEKGQLLICLPMESEYALSAQSNTHLPHFERFEPTKTSWSLEPVTKTITLQAHKAVTVTTPSKPVIMKNVLFDTDEATLTSPSFVELDKLVMFLTYQKEAHIVIRGHTDNVGEEDSNVDLSTRRAKTVYAYLIDKGIAPARLAYEGLGESIPISSNETEDGRQQNRRTEFVILR